MESYLEAGEVESYLETEGNGIILGDGEEVESQLETRGSGIMLGSWGKWSYMRKETPHR